MRTALQFGVQNQRIELVAGGSVAAAIDQFILGIHVLGGADCVRANGVFKDDKFVSALAPTRSSRSIIVSSPQYCAIVHRKNNQGIIKVTRGVDVVMSRVYPSKVCWGAQEIYAEDGSLREPRW